MRRHIAQHHAALYTRANRRPSVVNTTELRRELEELVAALARRRPHCERAGEAAILRDAEMLRKEALKRLATLDEETVEGRT